MRSSGCVPLSPPLKPRACPHHAERLERPLQVALHVLGQLRGVVSNALAIKGDRADLQGARESTRDNLRENSYAF